MRALMVLLMAAALAPAQTTQPLHLEKTIELPEVRGRIDHMSMDVKGQRLFVSALGNNTVEVIDIAAGSRIKTITGLQEPQGVLYVPENDRLFVANAKDGSVRIFVGYGSGALGEIDNQGGRIAETRLDAHPESFQLEKNTPRTYVNLPKARKIAVVDREKRAIIGTWQTGMAFANYPMALDEAGHRLFVVTRFPARLLVFDTNTGKIVQSLPAVGDCDDVFYDQARKRIYASGGEGAISVFERQAPDRYKELARIATVKGARTSFFSPDSGLLFVAIRRQGLRSAAIEVFAPVPSSYCENKSFTH